MSIPGRLNKYLKLSRRAFDRVFKRDCFGNYPYWWQWLFPRFGNYGGPGWSACCWNPHTTDWTVIAIDKMDELFKAHDWAYQHKGDLDAADQLLVSQLLSLRVTGIKPRLYRMGAIVVFTVWPYARSFLRGEFMRPRFWFCLCALLAVAGMVFAGEVPIITPAEFTAAAPTSPEAHWIWTFLASDAVYSLWLWLWTVAVAAVVSWRGWKNTRKEQALLCLREGIKVVGDTWVRSTKQARSKAGGKLTEEERRQANREAIEVAIELMKNQGYDLFKVLAKESLPALVDSLVRRIKGESAASKNPLPISQPPLPDLAPSLSSGA